MHFMARGAGGADQLVAGIRNQRSAGIADQGDRFLGQSRDDPLALLAARVIIVAAHRRLRADMGKQLGGDSRVFDEDQVGAAQGFGGAGTEIAEIADRSGHEVQPGWKPISHEKPPISSSNSIKKESSSRRSSVTWGERFGDCIVVRRLYRLSDCLAG